MKLTDKNIQTIKYEKRIGFVFSGLILSFGGLFNLFYWVTTENKNLLFLLLIDLLLIGLCILIIYLMNRQYNKDLKAGVKVIKLEKIQKKESQPDHEAGSGSLHIPILGDLFPKI